MQSAPGENVRRRQRGSFKAAPEFSVARTLKHVEGDSTSTGGGGHRGEKWGRS